MFFGPKRNTYLRKYILCTDSTPLTDPSCYLHGIFNFDSHSDIIIVKEYIALIHWEYPLTVCNTFSIIPPILNTFTNLIVSTKKRKTRS